MITVVCEWFALCTNDTDKASTHPVLGPVPICDRCAKRMGITPDLEIKGAIA
jgi:hypothetical protein